LFIMTIPDAYFRNGAESAFLGDEDRGELVAMAGRKRRAQFAAGRVLARHALHHGLGGDASSWRIARTASGQLRPALNGCEASLSVSHSGNLALCGVAGAGLLGVDVERCLPRRCGWPALADAVLHPLERERLAALPEPERWRGFYVVWTLKEALAKALGLGLALAFDGIAFAADGRMIVAPEPARPVRTGWRFATLDLGIHAVGAMAWQPH